MWISPSNNPWDTCVWMTLEKWTIISYKPKPKMSYFSDMAPWVTFTHADQISRRLWNWLNFFFNPPDKFVFERPPETAKIMSTWNQNVTLFVSFQAWRLQTFWGEVYSWQTYLKSISSLCLKYPGKWSISLCNSYLEIMSELCLQKWLFETFCGSSHRKHVYQISCW